MTADIKLLPLPEGVDVIFSPDGNGAALDVFTAEQVQDYARANMEPLIAEIEDLRAEVAAWRELSDHVRAGACNAIWPDRYTDARTRDVAAALKRAERLAEALLEVESELGPEVPLNHDSGNAVHRALSAAMAALNQEGGNPMSTGPTKWRAEHCTTHHHACDCREWEYACKIERLEAALEAAREDAAKWRRYRAFSGATNPSHRCIACGHGYSPLPNENEDCPVCLHDGSAIDAAREPRNG